MSLILVKVLWTPIIGVVNIKTYLLANFHENREIFRAKCTLPRFECPQLVVVATPQISTGYLQAIIRQV